MQRVPPKAASTEPSPSSPTVVAMHPSACVSECAPHALRRQLRAELSTPTRRCASKLTRAESERATPRLLRGWRAEEGYWSTHGGRAGWRSEDWYWSTHGGRTGGRKRGTGILMARGLWARESEAPPRLAGGSCPVSCRLFTAHVGAQRRSASHERMCVPVGLDGGRRAQAR
jgi:hypothetical protein